MLFTTKWLTEIFPSFRGQAEDHIPIEAVTTDSRLEIKKGLFIPIIGENFDGHDYLKQAFDNGVVAALWDKEKSLPEFLPTDFPVFFVDDTTEALQELAASYRDDVNPIVIGITGSNGKTTTKDIVSSVVKQAYRTHHTIGNFNNHIGMPLTILAMDRNTEVLVLEMGMSDFGEIELLSRLAKPDYAILTNIGESHIEYLGSKEGIVKAKLEIMSGLKAGGYLIIDGDEPLLEHLHESNHTITCGFHENNDIRIAEVSIEQKQTNFQLADGSTYSIPLLGKHHAKNAAYAIALAKQLGIDYEKIKCAFESLELTSMRFEMLKGLNDVSIINDAYNASPTSMKAAIEVVKQLEGFENKILILGDILELGNRSLEFHQSVASVIEQPVTALFTLGNDVEVIASTVKEKNPLIQCKHFTSKEELIATLQNYLSKNTLILFKASRGMQFESLVEKIT